MWLASSTLTKWPVINIEPGGAGIFSIVQIEFKPISAIFCVSSFANARGLSEFAQQFG